MGVTGRLPYIHFSEPAGLLHHKYTVQIILYLLSFGSVVNSVPYPDLVGGLGKGSAVAPGKYDGK